MRVFLNVQLLYERLEDRTNELLYSVYSDKQGLMKSMEKIISEDLNPTVVKGRSILLKPNWVKHSLVIDDDLCLRTHDQFILAFLRLLLRMHPSKVVIGDAPVQGCKWDKLLSIPFIEDIKILSEEFRVPIKIIDFRRRRYNVADNSFSNEIRPLSEYVIFDLGEESQLETITSPGKTQFRVTNYDPDRMEEAHSPGIHKYCIVKEFFDADIVISLPKIKTHQKTGITGAVKNLVGINGDKDFLPHHRQGGTKKGGDCYPGGSILRYWAELARDEANRRQGIKTFWYWQKMSSFLWRLSIPGPEHQMEAGWHGNDTTWRMVLDINRIAEFGKKDGTISLEKQRQIYSLCDGIIAGQGEGPLKADTLPLGVISFTNNSVLNDRAMALMMGFSPDRIPLLNKFNQNEDQSDITLNGQRIQLDFLKRYAQKTKAPRGWAKYFSEHQ